VDVSSYESRDKVSDQQFVPASRDVLAYKGKRCALPYLADTYGLYYNPDLLARSGFTHPPTTTDELVDMAVKLTQYNPDGSIKVAGFAPLIGFLENWTTQYAGWFGAKYFDGSGKANLSSDSHWTTLFQVQKRIIDAIGLAKLKRFAATAGNEWSADHPFENGKIAMMMDGEWRTALIAADHPMLRYATAGLPAPAGDAGLAGAAQIGPGLLGVTKDSQHRDAAWELVRYLALETGPMASMASAIHNMPTTVASLNSPAFSLGPHGAPFIAAVNNPRSSHAAILDSGPVYYDPITQLTQRWQDGKISDLPAALRDVDKQIDTLVAQN
jgi:multiple sugar transport system substrate-binding protein